MSKTLRNPIDKDVAVTHLGVDYSLKAGDSIVVSDEIAIFWRRLHGFLIEEEGEAIVEKKVEKKEEVVEEVEEDEEPKKELKKSKKDK